MSSLARAREATVLRQWQGAGYYARARHLHAAARQIVRDHQGRLPDSVEELRKLPGFGPYISRAVAALAFDWPVVALEANGRRVAARWWGVRGDPREPSTGRRLERRLASILPIGSAGAFNEAVMELGETVCLPRSPRCPICPVRAYCRAYATLRDPGAIPPVRGRPRRPHVRASVIVVESAGRYLVQRRPPTGLLGGLFEFPGGKIEAGEAPADAARRELYEETGIRLRRLDRLGVVRHGYSHFTVELHVFLGRLSPPAPQPRYPSQRWASAEQLTRLPLPKATEKIVALVRSD